MRSSAAQTRGKKFRSTSRRSADPAWTLRSVGPLRVLEAAPLARLRWLIHGFSTRRGGASVLEGRRVLNLGFTDWDAPENVRANRAQFVAALGGENWRLVALRQLHTGIVNQVDSAPVETLRGDALLTCTPGLLLAVQAADCFPILLADPRRRVVAAIHAGWRGTLQRVAQKTIGSMRMSWSSQPSDIIAAIGPGIGPCCYEVGRDVAQGFASQFADAGQWFDPCFSRLVASADRNPVPWLSPAPPGHPPPAERARLNLAAANRWQLLDAGVREENIVASPLCTACRTDLFFSHRQEAGPIGRMMAVIGIRAGPSRP